MEAFKKVQLVKSSQPNTLRQILKPKEYELVKMVSEGGTYQHIAEKIGTTEKCCKNKMQKILDKTGADNRIQLVARCAREELLEELDLCTSRLNQLQKTWNESKSSCITPEQSLSDSISPAPNETQ